MLASYPTWARTLAAVGFAVGFFTLLLAPRSTPSAKPSDEANAQVPAGGAPHAPTPSEVLPPPASKESEDQAKSVIPPVRDVWLVIERVDLFPPDSSAEVQVTAFVNDTPFRYPSVAGIEWLRVGPSMSSQRFKLPRSTDGYNIRFEMTLRTGSAEKRFASQATEVITSFPSEGSYNLHQVNRLTRAANVAAAVVFSVRN